MIIVQREFRTRFRKDTPHKNNTNKWYREFVETAFLCKGKRSSRPRVSDNSNERVSEVFQQSPRKSVATANREMLMPKITVRKVLRKRLCLNRTR